MIRIVVLILTIRKLKTTVAQGAKSDVSKGIDVRHQMVS
jgi:hypothetical protein